MKKYIKPFIQEDIFTLEDVILVSYSNKGHDVKVDYDEAI